MTSFCSSPICTDSFFDRGRGPRQKIGFSFIGAHDPLGSVSNFIQSVRRSELPTISGLGHVEDRTESVASRGTCAIDSRQSPTI